MYIDEIIKRLSNFWHSKGFEQAIPIDTEVGAGTLHPATAIRCITEDNFSCFYVQPCRRPSDNRCNSHKSDRSSLHHQFQVIMSPMPNNGQDLYLESLSSLGINFSSYIIDFIGDNWQNPSIGAWGIGSEVACNGIEITQLTYFKQVGGIELYNNPFEITYGLERIGMVLQKVSSIFDVKFSENISFRDMIKISEKSEGLMQKSHRSYEYLYKIFNAHIEIAEILNEEKAYYTAYINCLKASHIFNLIEAQGNISNKKRNQEILAIRKITSNIFKNLINSKR